jgi:hypothetical protein
LPQKRSKVQRQRLSNRHFGYNYAFDKPSDLVRLTNLSSSSTFSRAMAHGEYVDEANFWYTNHNPIYIRYVSNAADYGFDSSKVDRGVQGVCRRAASG